MSEVITPLRQRAASESRYFFTLPGNDDRFRVIAFESGADDLHALSSDYAVDLTLSADTPLRDDTLLNKPGRLSLHGGRGSQELHGLVILVVAMGRNLGKFEYRLRLASPLSPLKQERQTRIFRKRTVIEIVGVGQLDDAEAQLPQMARLLYVGMTRAMECLLVTTSKENELSRKLQAASAEA